MVWVKKVIAYTREKYHTKLNLKKKHTHNTARNENEEWMILVGIWKCVEQSFKCAYFMPELYMYLRLALSALSYLTVSKAMVERLLKNFLLHQIHIYHYASIITLCFSSIWIKTLNTRSRTYTHKHSDALIQLHTLFTPFESAIVI